MSEDMAWAVFKEPFSWSRPKSRFSWVIKAKSVPQSFPRDVIDAAIAAGKAEPCDSPDAAAAHTLKPAGKGRRNRSKTESS